ncbi:hypothetical protein K488DRAFT_82051 [Vararia minispora EC-137]|uniref:Uncharacterized protein n=1 Tax=Vararia minispora EC-137 TaxID=1314806 RepID=A0ACB8QX41_9AGAM|nr:hypothetical protein K488DRAFT_82051 [Vararia minispora EC-137]
MRNEVAPLGERDKYKKRALISIMVQTPRPNVIGVPSFLLQTAPLLSGIYGTIGVLENDISILLVDKIAVSAREFANGDNKAIKRSTVFGVHLFATVYCGLLSPEAIPPLDNLKPNANPIACGLDLANSTTWLYGVEALSTPSEVDYDGGQKMANVADRDVCEDKRKCGLIKAMRALPSAGPLALFMSAYHSALQVGSRCQCISLR